jgi:hypothetical protein
MPLISARATDIQGSTSCVNDRRDPPTREWLLARVRSEFTEMPDLILTPAQGARLFAIRQDICVRVLRELKAEGILCQASGDRYARRWSAH